MLSGTFATLGITVLVVRRIDYTLATVVSLSFLPLFQTGVLWGSTRKGSPRRRSREVFELAARRSVQIVWIIAAVIFAALLILYCNHILSEAAVRNLLMLTSGCMLTSAGVSYVMNRRKTESRDGSRRLVACAAGCGVVGFVSIASGLGFRLLPPYGIVTASVWGLAAACSLPMLLFAAHALRAGPAVLLESAALLAAAVMSMVPILLYVRPFLGSSWLDPCRSALVLGALLVVTASLGGDRCSQPDPEHRACNPVIKVHQWIAVWLTLEVSYVVGALFLDWALAGAPDLSRGAWVKGGLVPAIQTLAIVACWYLQTRRGETLA